MTWKAISKQLSNIDLHFTRKISKINKKNSKFLKFNRTALLVKTQFKNIKKKILGSILNQLPVKVSIKNKKVYVSKMFKKKKNKNKKLIKNSIGLIKF